jgi:hypothetical protein
MAVARVSLDLTGLIKKSALKNLRDQKYNKSSNQSLKSNYSSKSQKIDNKTLSKI